MGGAHPAGLKMFIKDSARQQPRLHVSRELVHINARTGQDRHPHAQPQPAQFCPPPTVRHANSLKTLPKSVSREISRTGQDRHPHAQPQPALFCPLARHANSLQAMSS